MRRSVLLLVDAVVNLALGVLLMFFPRDLVNFLGIPTADQAFYPSVLGAVLFGIGIALLLERRRGRAGPVGLGLGGAVCINVCGAGALALWLVAGDLDVPTHGHVTLWLLCVLLIGISLLEVLRGTRQA